MATNPKLPPRVERDDYADVVSTSRRNRWWPPVLIAIVVAVLIGLIVWVSKGPNRAGNAPGPQQVSGMQVQLNHLTSSPATRADQVEVRGDLVNNGAAPLAGVTVEATFRNINGNDLATESATLLPADAPAGSPGNGFADNPIAPGATRAIKVPFDHVPEGWNGKLPQLRVTQVQPAGQ